MFTILINIENEFVPGDFLGTTAKGGIKVGLPSGETVIMSKKMIDFWKLHPELIFHTNEKELPSGQVIKFLN